MMGVDNVRANTIAAIAGIIGVLLIVARLGYSRGIKVSVFGAVSVVLFSSLTFGYQASLMVLVFYSLMVIAPAFAMGKASRDLKEASMAVVYGLIPYLLFFIV